MFPRARVGGETISLRTERRTDQQKAHCIKMVRMSPSYPVTQDGRYLIVRDRLWRASNPTLPPDQRQALVNDLMCARRAVKAHHDKDDAALAEARKAVNSAKIALGERGPVWWTDGAPDYNRHLVANTPYATWYATLDR